MIRSALAVLTVFGSLMWATPVLAQVYIEAPFVRVYAGGPGGGTYVKAPFVTVDVPPKYPAYTQPEIQTQPAPVQIQPQIQTRPAPAPTQPPPVVLPPPKQQSEDPVVVLPPKPQTVVFKTPPMSHYQFAKIFQPAAGTYHVDLIHPGLCGNVVHACFTLPPGCPRVHVGKRYIEFDYGHCEVELRFALFGNFRVEYND